MYIHADRECVFIFQHFFRATTIFRLFGRYRDGSYLAIDIYI